MSRSTLGRLVMAAGVLCVLTVTAPHASLRAQAPAAAANVARDPDVLGAQRLFSAWLEGQVLSRHLPGIAVGVVANQELIWATRCRSTCRGSRSRLPSPTIRRSPSKSC